MNFLNVIIKNYKMTKRTKRTFTEWLSIVDDRRKKKRIKLSHEIKPKKEVRDE